MNNLPSGFSYFPSSQELQKKYYWYSLHSLISFQVMYKNWYLINKCSNTCQYIKQFIIKITNRYSIKVYFAKFQAYSIAFIKEDIGLVKEDLEFIRSLFNNVEQELYRDLWTRVLDVAYEAKVSLVQFLLKIMVSCILFTHFPMLQKGSSLSKEVQFTWENLENRVSFLYNSSNKSNITHHQ